MKNYTDKKYWDLSYEEHQLIGRVFRNEITQKIDEVIDYKGISSCIEIGCYPGYFLSYFGNKGCLLYGIDFVDRVDQLEKWLNTKYKVGKIWKGDFNKTKINRKFDIVSSFGFIEHFIDYKKIIKKHMALVNENGIIILSTPNFSGIIQRVFHVMLDRSNLSRHNIESMNTKIWEKILVRDGFEILFSGPIGGISFWVGNTTNNKIIKWFTFNIINIATHLNKLKLRSSIHYSPTLLLIARRK